MIPMDFASFTAFIMHFFNIPRSPPGRAVRRQDRAAAPTPGAAGTGRAELALLRGRRAPPARSRQGRPHGRDPRKTHGREGRRGEPGGVVEEPRHRGARGRQADHRRGAGGLARGQGREHLQARQAAAERRAGGRRAVREAARGGAVARRRRHPGRLGPGQQVPHEDHQGHLRPRHAAEDQARGRTGEAARTGRTGRERTAKPRTGEGPRAAYGRTTRAGGEPDAGHETARTVRRRAAGPQRARGLGRGQPVRITPGPQDQGRPAQRDQTAHGQAHRPAGGRTAADRPMERATAPEARTRPLEQLSGVLRMMFAVASVKRAETAFPGLHGAVEVVTRGRHVEQLSGREHLAVPGDARPMARILRLPRLHGPGVDHRRGLAGEREHEPRQPAFHVLALDLQSKEWPTLLDNRLEDSFVEISHLLGCGFGNAEQSAELVAADLPDSGAAVLFGPAVELLGVLALEVGELGQLEARELAGQVVEQERELLVDPNREGRLLRVGNELREQRELDDLARILEHVVQRQQPRVRLHDLVGQLPVGQVLPQPHEAAQLLERELHRGRALLPHP